MIELIVSYPLLSLLVVVFGVPALCGVIPLATGYGSRGFLKVAASAFVVVFLAVLCFMVWGMFTMQLNVH